VFMGQGQPRSSLEGYARRAIYRLADVAGHVLRSFRRIILIQTQGIAARYIHQVRSPLFVSLAWTVRNSRSMKTTKYPVKIGTLPENATDLRGECQALFADWLFEHAFYRQYLPPDSISHQVARFWVGRGSVGPHRLIPDGCVDIRLDWKDPKRCVVVGPGTSSAYLVLSKPYEFVGVRLRPATASALLGIPIKEFRNDRVSLADTTGFGNELIDRVGEATTLYGAFREVVRFFTKYVPTIDVPNSTIVSACGLLIGSRGILRVRELSEMVGLSRQHLHHLFDVHVGISPKQFARTVRMRSILATLPQSPDWSQVAAEAGYVDQSHLICDFKDLVGMTPEEYARTSRAE
jgi:AraC-like DNA-binding protein